MSHSASSHSTPPLKMGLSIPDSKLCLWLFLGTEIMFFTAFIGTYIVLRMGSPGWPSDYGDTHINVRAGGINTFVLIFSSYLVVVAHEAMHAEEFKKAWNCMVGVMVAGVLFLGIKGYEYNGKFTHDIVPGHIAENDDQALQKLVVECEVSRDSMQVALLEQKAEVLDGIVVELKRQRGDHAGDALEQHNAAIEELEKQITGYPELSNAAARGSAIAAAFDAEAAGVDPELAAALKSNMAALTTYEASLGDLKKKVRSETLEIHTGTDHELNPYIDELIKKNSDPANGEFVADHFHAHEPHPMPFGNVFASVYFLMTGFHAIHVIVGMILWGIVLAKGSSLDGSWSDFVENSGLYWHFVDLVWIFLFPLIYIVKF